MQFHHTLFAGAFSTALAVLSSSTFAASTPSEWQQAPDEYYANGEDQVIAIDENVSLTSADQYKNLFAAVKGGKIVFTGDQLQLSNTVDNTSNDTEWSLPVLYAFNGGTITIGSTEKRVTSVDVNSETTTDIAVGLNVRNDNNTSRQPSVIDIHAGDVNISAKSQFFAYGIYAMNQTTTAAEGERSYVNIDADRTVIDVTAPAGQSNGIIAWSQAKVLLNDGDVVIRTQDFDGNLGAGNAINTRGHSLVEINVEGDPNHVVQIVGDVNYEYNQSSSQTAIDSDVTIRLTNADSFFEGNVYTTSDVSQIPDDKDDVTGMTLGLENGGRWTTAGSSFVNNLTMTDGVLEIAGDATQTVLVERLDGTGGTVRIAATKTEAGVSSGTLDIRATTADAAPKLDVSYTGVTADDFANGAEAVEALGELAGNIKVGDGANVSGAARIREGFIHGAVSGNLDFSGPAGAVLDPNTVHTGSMSSTMHNMRDVAAVALVAWRQEDSALSERLGDLRRAGGDQGLWTRWNRGEFEYSGAFENKYDFLQIGYDRAIGDWHAGLAFSYNDGETTYEAGTGENQSVSALAYGTWLGQAGLYADLVVKVGRLSNEFDNTSEAGVTKGDYDAWGTSLSAEVGKAFTLTERFTLTPQAQLSYMWVGSEDYDANAGGERMKVEQDSMQSIVGRLGVKFDAKLAESTNVYAKASVLHDFDGEAQTHVSMQDAAGSFTQDIGGTWTDCGLGFDFKLGESAYFWADVTRTFGSDVETPWQWNVGGRYVF